MNRRQKIIVSVTGIFLVLLILVGLTYAYFLTRINGNTNTKSISVSTANLALVYGDGNGILEVGEVLSPGNDVKFKKANEELVDKKTFSVTNQGNAKTDYVVVIEDVNVTYTATVVVDGEIHTGGTSTTFASNDFVYTLTCTSGCNGVDEDTTFPINGGILVGNSIDVGEEQTYELRMTYLETGEDQSSDMNKTMTARVNIKDISTINPYSSSTNSLAYNIINNAMLNKNGTQLVATPLSGVATSISGKNFKTTISEGTSTITSVDSEYAEYFWTYADGYTLDPENGFTLTGLHTCKYSSCYENLTGKYLVSNSASNNASSIDATIPVKGLTSIYKVITAGTSSTGSVSLARYSIPITTVNVNESVLSIAQDDLGTSYYYRGTVEDNYVNFAGMCWRIVRIEGDGSTKLILEDQDQECSTTMNGNFDIATAAYGYKYAETKTRINYLNYEGGMADGLENFQTTKLSSVINKLKAEDWCYDVTAFYKKAAGLIPILDTESYYANEATFYYGTYNRLANKKAASLKCFGAKMNTYRTGETMYVGALTADEVVYAGGKSGKDNKNYYLINDYSSTAIYDDEAGEEYYMYWWTLSPSMFGASHDYAYYVDNNGNINADFVDGGLWWLRPAVTLASGLQITGGDGTKSNPYIIN